LNQVHAFPNSGARGETLESGSADTESGSGIGTRVEARDGSILADVPQLAHDPKVIDPGSLFNQDREFRSN
jgi:hypothetical protein